ncbi:MAG: LOG family protein [Candidatus Latescibacterota bacterium]|nr:MAG: LOG family protein [Candidatus Latescibacterota bacterium]
MKDESSGPRKRTLRQDQIEQLTKSVSDLLGADDTSLRTILCREILVNSLKLENDDLDILDLKIINRSFRELRYAFKVFKPYRHIRKVSIFGSARTPEDSPYYKMAVKFARLLSKQGYMVITGAADGIMKAGNEGAGTGKSFGVNIHLPFEQGANEYIVDDPKLVTFKYFFTRKLIFVMESHAIALFPGGFGTHDESFETLTLLQTEKASPRPFLLMELPGETYWERWDDFVRGQLLNRGMISSEDVSLYRIVHSAEKGVDEVKQFYSTYHSSRQVGGKLVIRLEKDLPTPAIKTLNEQFGDLVAGGEIERTYALPEEANEPELLSKPRIAFQYDHSSAGKLRELIDQINKLGRFA